MWNAIYHGILGWAKAHGLPPSATKDRFVKVQTDHLLIIRRKHSMLGWCPQCGCEAEMVSLQDAAAIVGMVDPASSGAPPGQKWHLCPTEQETLVCLKSLLMSL